MLYVLFLPAANLNFDIQQFIFIIIDLLHKKLICILFPLSAGSKDHIMVQGEILEGLVARTVSQGSSEHMKQVLRDNPPPPMETGNRHLLYMN